ncbi:MAG: secondary thiamine-phosphate synthase enzyme YjbQ [Gammaproteobacteria bacterium]|nr:secondary thiamine-phosphate synthase enzyme YjbQ [Gammaproteobacteria bacterium]
MVISLYIPASKQGLHNITNRVESQVQKAGFDSGLCTLFIKHTSASLIIQENADPSAKCDLEAWLSRLVPENDSLYTHTHEGPDDMPSHIKSILTSTSLSVPVQHGKLALGIWQGIYLWEHRHSGGEREIAIHISN